MAEEQERDNPTSSYPGEYFRIILVEPGDSLNIGAVARAMMNLGFTDLHLVAPRNFEPKRAAVTACWATKIVECATIHTTLDDALGPCEDVVGFTVRPGKNRPPLISLPEWAEEKRTQLPLRTGLLFGPEEAGLSSDHLNACRKLVRIPSTGENPSYNLAQAVLLALYELCRLERQTTSSVAAIPFPCSADLKQLDHFIETTAAAAGFFRATTPPELPDLLKNLFRRLGPNQRELNILLGLFRRIDQALRREHSSS